MPRWLIKSEPTTYSWATFTKDKKTRWDGVRNFEARNNLRAMQVGDEALFYHSSVGKEIVGVAKVIKAPYKDPTAPDEDWTSVDFAPSYPLAQPVTLADIKASDLKTMALVKKSRISVVPVTDAEFSAVLKRAKTKPGGKQ